MTRKENSKVEITAPVGSWESLHAALNAGADSVYFGVSKLNMRSRSSINFTLQDLQKIVKICKDKEVKTYLTVNIVMYDKDLPEMRKICNSAKKYGVTAVICTDVATIQYARSIDLEVHASTQLNVSNIEAVKFFSQWCDVIVLARELKLEQIKHIIDEIRKQEIKGPSGNLVQIELFVHGALCVSISGKCYMSLATYNFSANRGACLQNCRRKYRLYDEETGNELVVDNQYIMSPKDLCTIGFIDKIIEAGVRVFKIEGRGRSPDYVDTAVKVYKEAVDSYVTGEYTTKKAKEWTTRLEEVFNRGFWHGGYYLGKKLGEWSGVYGSKATKKKEFVGIVKNYFSKAKVGEFDIQTGEIEVGDNALITGPTTGVLKFKVESIFIDEKPCQNAGKGSTATITVPEKVRKNDKLFLVKDKT
ncbi:U32 family peptidase [Candidatus Woesearchaeota archaeon]|nr:U32 family peptidase [Candidatus Woesearchaeota archaeon]